MILAGHPRERPVACEGLLIVGDPHVGSRRPGRRKDPDWPCAVLAKLERCVAIANDRHLAPILLGDLFERAVEPDESLKTRLIRIFREFRIRPLANVGNHDMAHTTLSDGDSLAVLGVTDVLDIAARSGPAAEFRIAGRRLGVGMTPYGQEIPDDVRGLFPGADRAAWFTHHDIAFMGAYPRSIPPFAIAGCELVVNGHVHGTKPPVRVGATLWTNPGNIARLSADLGDHVPRAWVLGPDGELAPEVLPHAADVFDLTGRLVTAASRSDIARHEGAFASLLEAEAAATSAKSDDATILAEEIRAKFERDRTPAAIRAIVESLLAEAVERRAAR